MTPLHIQIALHYHCRTDQFEMVLTNETRRQYAEDLVRAGLLLRISADGLGSGYERTEGLAVFVEALCSTPFPVQRWVMPASRAVLAAGGGDA